MRIGTTGANTYTLISRQNGTTIVNGIGIVKGQLGLGDAANDGRIDCNAAEANNRDLRIGTLNNTRNVVVGRANRDLTVNSATLDLEGQLRVGPAAAAGSVDSGGALAAPQDLNVGTNGVTRDVTLSRPGQVTRVNSQLRVGGWADAGRIDADLPAFDLRVGTMPETLNVHISRPGQAVIINNTIRIQLDAALNATVILNGDEAQNINDPLARGIADNPAGHGFGPSIDFVTEGVPRFCVDNTGGHNV